MEGLFPTIEDYMWFQLALVRSAPVDDDGSGTVGVAASGIQVATLEGLQHYLCHFPPGHYSHQGESNESVRYSRTSLPRATSVARKSFRL